MADEEEEDRISNLPDEIIHRILSFFDLKYAVQTSALSKKWKHIWTLMPKINLDRQLFRSNSQFSKFVKKALSDRDNRREVSGVDLRFKGSSTQFLVKRVVNYAYSHNVRQLTVVWDTKDYDMFPECIFSCRTLKHLTLIVNDSLCIYGKCSLPESAWDFPALETLFLSKFRLPGGTNKSLNLFSKCVNLKDLHLDLFFMHGLERFDVCAPQLSKLTITNTFHFPKVFNVVAPHLQNLRASVMSIFARAGFDFLHLSEGLDSLQNVNLSWSISHFHRNKKETYFPQLLDLFRKLHTAKFLILDAGIIETLSSCLDQLSHEPCPFDNLKCLKINTGMEKENRITSIPYQVINYLLRNSPSATFIMDSPQVPQKRSRQKVHNDATAKKKAKSEVERKLSDTIAEEKRMLEEKIQMQDEVIAEQKAIHEKLMSHNIKCKMAELRVQVEGGNPDYEVISSMWIDMKSIMNLIPESSRVNVEEQFSSQYEELKNLFLNCIDVSQWTKIETELGIIKERTVNIQSQMFQLATVPRSTSANMASSSSSVVSVQPSRSSHE